MEDLFELVLNYRDFEQFCRERKNLRKKFYKFLRDNSNLIEDPTVRRKLGKYVHEISDVKLLNSMKHVVNTKMLMD
jgi:hypothetical protein